ncbi:CinA family protein [Gulbenkiania mobilis]|uniref:Nicotinamide-nucleotide amidase n=1 Tax=Gulbenkiania mobilis TaxID=397457 RepID=A0ABY2CZ85_GULMO|nr:nicotinamide-nucleotide amidase [Gulbenkiania mobilis]
MQTENELAARLGDLLSEHKQRVATAESCTGGRIAASLTSVSGCSAWFGFGWVTYSYPAKMSELGVQAETLERDGAVSEQTVREMASGALERSGADWAVAVSGIAGPGGGGEKKPVGTVWFGLAGRKGLLECVQKQFEGDRDAVRRQATEAALQLLIERVEQQVKDPG